MERNLKRKENQLVVVKNSNVFVMNQTIESDFVINHITP